MPCRPAAVSARGRAPGLSHALSQQRTTGSINVLTPVSLPSVSLLSASSPPSHSPLCPSSQRPHPRLTPLCVPPLSVLTPVSLPSVSLLSASSPPSPPKMQGEGKDAYDDNIHYPILLTLTRGPLPPPLGHTQ
ncbi:unnamed protein product [Gadus morhua 'NCC']